MNGIRTNFWELVSINKICFEIPLIQRDYAQGRNDIKAIEIRKGILSSIKQALETEQRLCLDFVYGSIQSKKFIIIDGQQRLTTLFLLHWYLSVKEKEQFQQFTMHMNANSADNTVCEPRFTYKVRSSSNDFCEALILHSVELTGNGKISAVIKRSPWFFLSWKKDPTVKAMLNMLDSIHEEFWKTQDLFELLIDSEKLIVCFDFLEIDESQDAWEKMYITMNSRGKPLTRFENYKGKLLNYVRDRMPDVDWKDIAHKLDNQWQDLFWQKGKDASSDDIAKVIDTNLMGFICNFAQCYSLNIDSSNNVNPSLLTDKALLELLPTFYKSLFHIFDLFVENFNIIQDKDMPYNFDESKSFVRFCNTDIQFCDKAIYYAYLRYRDVFSNHTEFAWNWMRVFSNLCENTRLFFDADRLISTMKEVERFLYLKNPNIQDIICSRTIEEVKGFISGQFKEEVIKCYLMDKPEWKSIILESEKNTYFTGQLSSIICFSGIESFYDKNQACNWASDKDSDFLTKFIHYRDILFQLFKEREAGKGLLNIYSKNNLLRRALLAKGDFLLQIRSTWSFVEDYQREISWKRLLFGDISKVKQHYVKELIDDPDFDVSQPDSLEKICNKALTVLDKSDWRYYFVRFPEMFKKYDDENFLLSRTKWEDNSDLVYLLLGQTMGSWHSDIYTKYLYCSIQENLREQAKDISTIRYYPSDNYSLPKLGLGSWPISNTSVDLLVEYIPNTRKVKVELVSRDGNVPWGNEFSVHCPILKTNLAHENQYSTVIEIDRSDIVCILLDIISSVSTELSKLI